MANIGEEGALIFRPELCWFAAAIAFDDELLPAKGFAPRSDVRIGCVVDNDFVIAGLQEKSRLVLSEGRTLHLVPGSMVRMAGSGRSVSTADYESAGPTIDVVAERVNLRIDERIAMFIRYHPTADALEQFLGEVETARQSASIEDGRGPD